MKITLNTIKYFNSKLNYKKQDNPINHNKDYRKTFDFPNGNFYNILSFGAKRCSPANFKIKEIKNLRCPVCSKIMLNEQQQNNFIKSVCCKKGEELKKALEFWEDERNITQDFENGRQKSLYRVQEQKVVDILKELTLKYPDKYLHELVQIQAKPYLENLMRSQLAIVEELEQYVQEKVPDSELVALKKIIEEQKKSILGQGDEFKRKKFIYAVSDTVSDPYIQNDIINIAFKMPNSQNDINSFFVKYSRENKSSKIALRLIQGANPTTEHLKPKSKGGADTSANYICDCADCNKRRDVTPFSQWQKDIPDFKENLQKYLEDVQDAVDEGVLPAEFENYIPNVIETIKTLSKNTILLRLPDSKSKNAIAQTLEKRKKLLNNYSRQINELIKVKREKRKEITDLEKVPHFKQIVQYGCIEQEISELDNEIENIEAQIEFDSENSSINPELEKELQETLREKETIIEKRKIIENAIPKLLNLEEPIKQTGKLLQNIEQIETNIEQTKEKIEQERQLQVDLNFAKTKIKALKQRNNHLEEINLLSSETYEQYLHYKTLLERCKAMEESTKSKPKSQRTQDLEILGCAEEAIKTRIKVLSQEEEIEYYLNLEEITSLQAKAEQIQQELEKLQNSDTVLEQEQQKLREILEGKTVAQIEKYYFNLKEQQTNVEKIMNIKTLQDDLNNLSDEIAYNLRILNGLRENYKAMSNEEFKRKIDSLYIKKIK